LQVVKKGNPNIVKLEMLKVQGNNFPLGVSIYEGDEVTSIENVLKKLCLQCKS